MVDLNGHKNSTLVVIVVSIFLGLSGVIFGLISSYSNKDVINLKYRIVKNEDRSTQNEKTIYEIKDSLAIQANETKHINQKLKEIKDLLKSNK